MRLLTLFTLAILVFTACREEGVSVTTTTTGPIPSPVIVTASITTVVINQNGTRLNNATISGVGTTSRENPNGSLTIDAGSLSTDGTLVTVSSPGHWPERRLLMPAGTGQLLETFVLEEKVVAGSIESVTGGTITLANNFTITISPNSVVTTSDGTTYTGPIEVSVNHDAPENAAEMLNSPGNALAQLANGELANLESLGMMDIALEAPDGTPLELNSANPAEIRFPLLSTTTPTAPNEIDFWRLSDNGFWQPSGTATKGDDCYIVFVTSSGGYNCDVPRPAAKFCGRLVDDAGFPLTHVQYAFNIPGGWSCWNAITDCNGEFCAWVAADTALDLMVFEECTPTPSSVPFSAIPVSQQFDAGDVMVDLMVSAFMVAIPGCGGTTNGDIANTEIWVNGYGAVNSKFVSHQANGTGKVSVADCNGDDVLIQAFTRDFRAASPLVRRSADDAAPQTLEVCGDLEAGEYFTLSIDGQEITITELAPIYWPDNGNFNWLVRAAGTLNGEEYSLLFNFSNPTVGILPSEHVMAAIYRLFPGQDYGEGKVYVDPTRQLEVTGVSAGMQGEVFEGSFTVLMNLQNDAEQTVEAVNLPVTATFRIIL